MQTVPQGIKSSTIRRKVSSISAIHRLSSLEDPTKHSEVRIIQRKIYRQLGTRFDQAYPITRALLTRLLAACEDDLHGFRDRALLLVAYDSMRRRTELISLRAEDIEWIPNTEASILLRKSKTDQHGTGKWIHLTTEATSALHQWLVASKINEGLILEESGRRERSQTACVTAAFHVSISLLRGKLVWGNRWCRASADTLCALGERKTY